MKQLYLAVSLYCDDYQTRRVPHDLDNYAISNHWNVLLIKTGYILPAPSISKDADTPASTPAILQCPSFKDKRGWGYTKSTEYGINDYLRKNYAGSHFPNEDLGASPEKTCYLGERSMLISPVYNWPELIEKRHGQTVGFLFLTGHVRILTLHQIPFLFGSTGTSNQPQLTIFWRSGPGPYTDWQ